jgi:hypothetical protein
MSAASDKYEKDVADAINKMPGLTAIRPIGDTAYADVKVTYNNITSWLEVKMNHTDNLANPRMFFKNGKWDTTYSTPAAKAAVNILNNSSLAKKFIADLSKFSGIPVKNIKIPTTKGGLKEEGAVPLHIMKAYFEKPGVNRYIANNKNIDLGKIVTEHYTKGKADPAYYMQAGDDFYRISNKDPFKLGSSIPLLSGQGEFKVRVSTRSEFYEVQVEIKIQKMPNSKYSVKPGTKKLNPFLK